MLAEKDAVMDKAISGVWQLTEEERIREQCRAREEWLVNDKWKMDKIAEQEAAIKEYEVSNRQKSETIAELQWQVDSLKQEIEYLKEQIKN